MTVRPKATILRRLSVTVVASIVGLSLGVVLTGVVERHNDRAVSRWKSASRVHDALIELATLEAIRAEMTSAGQFDMDQLLQDWRDHESVVKDLLASADLRALDAANVQRAERAFSIYGSAAATHVAFLRTDPAFAQQVGRDRVVPAFGDLRDAVTALRSELDRLGPDAQSKVDRELRLVLPTLTTALLLVAFATVAGRRRAAVQRAEARQDARFRAIVQGATDVLTVVDSDGHFREVSAAASMLFGRADTELIGEAVKVSLDPTSVPAFVDAHRCVTETRRTMTVTLSVQHTDGRVRIVEVTGSAPDALEGTAWVWHDVSAQTELGEQLRRQAFHDGLTGLANRALLRDRASMALTEPSSVAMLLIDVDRFQRLNDALGHSVGDEILRAIAGRMRACVRPGDTVARLGSDEFAALVSGADSRALEAIVERMLETCRLPLKVAGHEVRTTISIGIATSQHGGDVEDLLRRADTALATAKASGRDRSQMHIEAMDQRARHRVVLANDLHHAVERNELVAMYQPIVSLADGRVTGFESLLRWRHRDHGMVSPVEFIPLSEDNGTIIPIGRWILRTAVAQAALLPAPLRMNVNLSARQLAHPEIINDVRCVLLEAGIDPGRVVLEITESMLLDDGDSTISVLQQLRDLGCLLAIDDFGTGYSSLGYLRKLPVNIVKLDKSFLDARSSTVDGERAFLDSVLQLGRTLGLETVAEGIEDLATWEILRSIGCEKGQGFYFSRPVEASAIDELLLRSYQPL